MLIRQGTIIDDGPTSQTLTSGQVVQIVSHSDSCDPPPRRLFGNILMTPQELYDEAGIILIHCDATGVPTEYAADFLQSLQTHLLSIHKWLPPSLGAGGMRTVN